MSIIRVKYGDAFTSHELTHWPHIDDNVKERYVANKGNFAKRVAHNTGFHATVASEYKSRLVQIPEYPSADEQLSIDSRKSPYLGSSGGIVRNVLILKSPDEAYEIAFYDVKMKVTQTKTIKETALTGRAGSIKEYIQAKDYQVIINGTIISDNPNGFPIVQLREVVELMKQPEVLEVASAYLQHAYGITRLVFKKADYDQMNAKHINTLPFNFEFVSDEDYDLHVQ